MKAPVLAGFFVLVPLLLFGFVTASIITLAVFGVEPLSPEGLFHSFLIFALIVVAGCVGLDLYVGGRRVGKR